MHTPAHCSCCLERHSDLHISFQIDESHVDEIPLVRKLEGSYKSQCPVLSNEAGGVCVAMVNDVIHWLVSVGRI
jgi:hypothetical protein